MTYCYSVLQFCPDPARGEAVNIGAVAGDDQTGDWSLRLIQNFRRAKAIDDRDRLPLALSFAATVEAHVSATEQLPGAAEREALSRGLLGQWSEEMRNVVRVTPPTPIVADSAESALDIVFEELLVDPTAQRRQIATKHRALSLTLSAYRGAQIPEAALKQRVAIETGPYDAKFDYAVLNGRVLQLVQCWSFQIPNQEDLAAEVRAWAWVVRELREHGGELRHGGASVAIPAGNALDIASVYMPPRIGQNETHAFDEAVAAFEETQVESVPADGVREVADRAAARLGVAA